MADRGQREGGEGEKGSEMGRNENFREVEGGGETEYKPKRTPKNRSTGRRSTRLLGSAGLPEPGSEEFLPQTRSEFFFLFLLLFLLFLLPLPFILLNFIAPASPLSSILTLPSTANS